MKHILAVYDVDPVYAARFAEVVNQKEKIPFEVVAFSSIERLRAFAAEHPVKLLLLGEHVPAEEKESIRAEKVILLSDNGGKPVSPSVPCVYKYQSSDAIVRDVMTWYGESPGDLPEVSGRGLAKVLGVYSPVGRCLKTSFALTMGKLLAQEERVLYLNLEEFSGLSVLMKEEYKSDTEAEDVLKYLIRNVMEMTTGLTGVKEESSPWSNLVVNVGVSDKPADAGCS